MQADSRSFSAAAGDTTPISRASAACPSQLGIGSARTSKAASRAGWGSPQASSRSSQAL